MRSLRRDAHESTQGQVGSSSCSSGDWVHRRQRLVGPATPGDKERDAVSFLDAFFHPPREVADFISFGASVEDDSMSLSVSEKDCASESVKPEEGPADLQEELFRILSKAVSELDLSWSAPDEPTKSKLDLWFLNSSRRQAA